MGDANIQHIAVFQFAFRFKNDEFVQFGSSAPACGVALADAFGKHLQNPADKLIVRTGGISGKLLQKDLISFFLDLLRNVIDHAFRGKRSSARGVFENKRIVESDPVHHAAGGFEILVGFTGEADNDIR